VSTPVVVTLNCGIINLLKILQIDAQENIKIKTKKEQNFR